MQNNRHHCTGTCVILLFTALSSIGHAAQPLPEGTLSLQTGALNNALPSIIIKAQQDALKPAEERWRSQRVLSDRNLREIRVSMLAEGGFSAYEEQKKTTVMDVREKRKATIKPHTEAPDRFMIYEFDSPNVKKSKITFR
ncbi:hypothetical protein AWW72_10360 [Acinetobacter sp. NRRL B-65365]|uniref:hypothetical protein n=1 Tax=Acinetobacter sp. NRRL B-65365 TaxID=1785092 RepID=UPI0007A0738A|nr:hypothetical protein [Acinetobacter sp. NRRL B-65365]KYQ84140.1 hypothetical protein AWW72_10360 [Acinetobacter sp. NRRL B-65365]